MTYFKIQKLIKKENEERDVIKDPEKSGDKYKLIHLTIFRFEGDLLNLKVYQTDCGRKKCEVNGQYKRTFWGHEWRHMSFPYDKRYYITRRVAIVL